MCNLYQSDKASLSQYSFLNLSIIPTWMYLRLHIILLASLLKRNCAFPIIIIIDHTLLPIACLPATPKLRIYSCMVS